MATVFINVSSITNAMRGKKLLERNHIRTRISRSQNTGNTEGCGYRLEITTSSDAPQAQALLKSAGIRIVNIT